MNRIEQLRKEFRLSQRELAEKINVHQTAVSQWETERTAPSFDALCTMGELFDVTPMYLMGTSAERGHFPNIDDADSVDTTTPLGRISAALDKLNSDGQEKAAERIEELTEIPKYQRTDSQPEPTQDTPEGKK